MTDPVSSPDHDPHHDHAHHHGHAHDHAEHPAGSAYSILRASALTRLGVAVLLLIPLWVAVYWVTAS